MFRQLDQLGVRVHLYRRPKGCSFAAIMLPEKTEMTVIRDYKILGHTYTKPPTDNNKDEKTNKTKEEEQTTVNTATQTHVYSISRFASFTACQIKNNPFARLTERYSATELAMLGCKVTSAYDSDLVLQIHLTIPENVEVQIYRKHEKILLVDTYYDEEKELNQLRPRPDGLHGTKFDESSQTLISCLPKRLPVVRFYSLVAVIGLADNETNKPQTKPALRKLDFQANSKCFLCTKMMMFLSDDEPNNTKFNCSDHGGIYACNVIRRHGFKADFPKRLHAYETKRHNKMIYPLNQWVNPSQNKAKYYIPIQTRQKRKFEGFSTDEYFTDLENFEGLKTFVKRIRDKQIITFPLHLHEQLRQHEATEARIELIKRRRAANPPIVVTLSSI